MNDKTIVIRSLGQQPYKPCWLAMQAFTQQRTPTTPDEIWLLEHPPVYTQGQNGKAEHIHAPGTIPIIQIDRGGQVTYHAPGQLIAYTLIDLKRKKINTREMVSLLENAVIALLQEYRITAYAKKEAPGIYVEQKKIASIGLRIRRGCSYHGLALNIAMDLAPFDQINPCGFSGLEMTQMTDITSIDSIADIGQKLAQHLITQLQYTEKVYTVTPPSLTPGSMS